VRTILLFCLVVISGLLLLGVMAWFVARTCGEDSRSDPFDSRMNTLNSFGAIRPIDQISPGKEGLKDDRILGGADPVAPAESDRRICDAHLVSHA
jgi:hypothetical protein